jgi:hypothetical protein
MKLKIRKEIEVEIEEGDKDKKDGEREREDLAFCSWRRNGNFISRQLRSPPTPSPGH